jgi:hypothetical protein
VVVSAYVKVGPFNTGVPPAADAAFLNGVEDALVRGAHLRGTRAARTAALAIANPDALYLVDSGAGSGELAISDGATWVGVGVAAAEDLRTVRGIVGSGGSVVAGAGFTVARTALGRYTVTFTTAFSAPPAVTVTLGSDATTALCFLKQRPAAGSFLVRAINLSSVDVDVEFDFIATGLR